MNPSLSVSGLVLAGGQAQRMQRQDKGLLRVAGQPLIQYALNALTPLVNEVFISANRNHDQYARWGHPVLNDLSADFSGPLAGILVALQHAQGSILLVTPCDVPLITSAVLQRLMDGLLNSVADIAVAHDGQYLQPTFLALRVSVQPGLTEFLLQGERKIKAWLALNRVIEVDVSDAADLFDNINTPQHLIELENKLLENLWLTNH